MTNAFIAPGDVDVYCWNANAGDSFIVTATTADKTLTGTNRYSPFVDPYLQVNGTVFGNIKNDDGGPGPLDARARPRHDEHRRALEPARDQEQHLAARRVHELEVVEGDQDGRPLGDGLHQRAGMGVISRRAFAVVVGNARTNVARPHRHEIWNADTIEVGDFGHFGNADLGENGVGAADGGARGDRARGRVAILRLSVREPMASRVVALNRSL